MCHREAVGGRALTIEITGDVVTLLGVRRDGVASVIDLVPEGTGGARERAEALLREHASCEAVEVWRGGLMVDKVLRT